MKQSLSRLIYFHSISFEFMLFHLSAGLASFEFIVKQYFELQIELLNDGDQYAA